MKDLDKRELLVGLLPILPVLTLSIYVSAFLKELQGIIPVFLACTLIWMWENVRWNKGFTKTIDKYDKRMCFDLPRMLDNNPKLNAICVCWYCWIAMTIAITAIHILFLVIL